MKKNLFLLFSLYFFVLQSRIIGFIRNDYRFLALGIINLGFIILISIIHIYIDKPEKKSHEEEDKSFSQEREIITEKLHKKNDTKHSLFWISVILSAGLFFFTVGDNIANRIIISFGLGFVFFLITYHMFKMHTKKKFFGARTSKVFLLIFVAGIVLSMIDNYILNQKENNVINDISNTIDQIISSENDNETEKNLYTGNGTVLGETYEDTNTGTNTEQLEQITDTGSSNTMTGNTTTGLETTVDTSITDDNIQKVDLTMIEAIKYLIKDNNVPLDTSKTIRFQYMSSQSPNYPYFKTAYSKKMIGSNTNPDKKIICPTYIVMKGLAKGRTLKPGTETVEGYRNEAKSRGELNGCEKGKIVNNQTL